MIKDIPFRYSSLCEEPVQGAFDETEVSILLPVESNKTALIFKAGHYISVDLPLSEVEAAFARKRQALGEFLLEGRVGQGPPEIGEEILCGAGKFRVDIHRGRRDKDAEYYPSTLRVHADFLINRDDIRLIIDSLYGVEHLSFHGKYYLNVTVGEMIDMERVKKGIEEKLFDYFSDYEL